MGRSAFRIVSRRPSGSGEKMRPGGRRAGVQRSAAVAVDDAGDFVIVWASQGQDGAGYGVYAQRFNAAGVAAGAEFRVNATTAGDQFQPSVAMDQDGDFVVSWSSPGQDGSTGLGVIARRFNSAGVAQGGELVVNSQNIDFDQQYSRVAMDAGGGFVVTWQSYIAITSSTGVYARRYDASGTALSPFEFLVNTAIAGDQSLVSVAVNRSTGDYVAVWSGNGAGDADGVFARWFRPTAPGITVTPISGLFTTEAGGTATFSIVLSAAPTADVSIGLSSSDLTEGTISAAQLTFTAANWDTPQT